MELVAERYKKTELGLIPSDWEVKELGSILTFGSGRDYKHLQNGEIPVYGTGGIMTYVDDFLYNGESVGIGRKGTIDKPVLLNGKFWTVDTLFYTYQFQNSNPKFIYYKFCLIKWKEYNEASGVPSLNKNTLEKIKISVPTFTEQNQIAQVLSDFDNLIDGLERLIAKKRSIKEGVMQELLRPKEGWKLMPLSQLAQIKTGKKDNQNKVEDGIYPFFVRSQKVERIDTYSYDGEAILIPGEGNIGEILHYVNGKFDYHQRVYKISDFDKCVLGKFIYYYLHEFFGQYALGNSVKATVDSLRLPTFKDFIIQFPPLEEQKAIAQVLSDFDNLIDGLERLIAKYRQIKDGVTSHLLTGKTRLV